MAEVDRYPDAYASFLRAVAGETRADLGPGIPLNLNERSLDRPSVQRDQARPM